MPSGGKASSRKSPSQDKGPSLKSSFERENDKNAKFKIGVISQFRIAGLQRVTKQSTGFKRTLTYRLKTCTQLETNHRSSRTCNCINDNTTIAIHLTGVTALGYI